MFASWSAGEYGNVGATEWLEVRLAFQRTILSDCAALQMLSNVFVCVCFRVICPLIRKF